MAESGFHFQVVGLRHHIEENQMRELQALCKKRPLKASLRRQPDNPADSNAIKVIVIDKRSSVRFIGYMGKALAKIIAPGLDENRWNEAVVKVESVNVKHAFAKAHISFKKKPVAKRKIKA